MKIIRINKKRLKRTLFLAMIITVVFGMYNQPTVLTYAYETTCPEEMSDEDCLEFLQEQASLINDEKTKLTEKISQEQYQQLSLNERIQYLSAQISASQQIIDELEVEIETKNVEIRILAKDISETENRIDTITQEVTKLESSIEKRVALSYKYSFMGPLELLLESKNFDSLIRHIKYLIEARKKDRVLLVEMEDRITELEDEKLILAEKKIEVQEKRNDVESQKSKQFQEKQVLADQQAEQQDLYNISKQKEAEYTSTLAELKSQEDDVTAQISAMIMALYNSGQLPANTPVDAGDIIGYQGHTGFSYGSHLHFNINGGAINPFGSVYLGLSGSTVVDGSVKAPLGAGAILTQGCHSPGCSIDMVGSYNWSYDKYYVGSGEVCCTGAVSYLGCVASGWYNLNGEGTPVRAIKSGKVTAVFTDSCGGKAVIVDHGDGDTSLYLHLR